MDEIKELENMLSDEEFAELCEAMFEAEEYQNKLKQERNISYESH